MSTNIMDIIYKCGPGELEAVPGGHRRALPRWGDKACCYLEAAEVEAENTSTRFRPFFLA